jgi:hypothetical protein
LVGLHKEAKEMFDHLQTIIKDFDNMNGLVNPENFLFEYFSNIRNQVDLHRELLIEEINTKYSEIIEDLKEMVTY